MKAQNIMSRLMRTQPMTSERRHEVEAITSELIDHYLEEHWEEIDKDDLHPVDRYGDDLKQKEKDMERLGDNTDLGSIHEWKDLCAEEAAQRVVARYYHLDIDFIECDNIENFWVGFGVAPESDTLKIVNPHYKEVVMEGEDVIEFIKKQHTAGHKEYPVLVQKDTDDYITKLTRIEQRIKQQI